LINSYSTATFSGQKQVTAYKTGCKSQNYNHDNKSWNYTGNAHTSNQSISINHFMSGNMAHI